MANEYESDAAIEDNRQTALAALDQEFLTNFAPGTMGAHEALHTCYVVQDMLDRHLLGHPTIILNAKWYRRASRAAYELAALYQEIGAANPLPTPPEPRTALRVVKTAER